MPKLKKSQELIKKQNDSFDVLQRMFLLMYKLRIIDTDYGVSPKRLTRYNLRYAESKEKQDFIRQLTS